MPRTDDRTARAKQTVTAGDPAADAACPPLGAEYTVTITTEDVTPLCPRTGIWIKDCPCIKCALSKNEGIRRLVELYKANQRAKRKPTLPQINAAETKRRGQIAEPESALCPSKRGRPSKQGNFVGGPQ